MGKHFSNLNKNRVFCVCCGWEGEKFLECPYGSKPHRKNSMCPNCKSLERHRLYYIFLKNIIPKKKIKVLHVAPERSIKKLFLSYSNINYVSIDLNMENVTFKEDVSKLSFNNETFDIIFCSHVLEHVKYDFLAIRELQRVLKKSGFAIIQVPIYHYFKGKRIFKTIEGDVSMSEKEREILFGQSDHLRAYGPDFAKKIRKAGFDLDIINFSNTFTEKELNTYRLITNSVNNIEDGNIYFCKK